MFIPSGTSSSAWPRQSGKAGLATFFALTAALIILALSANCGRKSDKTLATLGGRAISESDFQRYLASAYAPEQLVEIRQNPARRQAALDAYFDSLAIATKARQQGLDKELRFKKAVELMEVKTLAHLVSERYRGRIIAETQVPPDAVKRYYEEHKGDYTSEPRFTAHYLLVYVKGNPAFPEKGLGAVQARAKANAALRRLRSGASWDTIAQAYSDDVATNQKAGLIRDGQFGYFAPEVEQAIRTQTLGKPGDVVRSAFGYHVVEVESRIVDKTPEPFEKVEQTIALRLAQAHAAEVHKSFIDPIAAEVGFTLGEAAKRDVPLLNQEAVALNEILAEVAGRKVLESDFHWFLKDALIPRQRMPAYARPGARKGMLSSFLDMVILEAKARKDGLDKTPDFIRNRVMMEQSLLVEFMQERDKAGPFGECQESTEARKEAEKRYFMSVRAEVGLKIVADQSVVHQPVIQASTGD